MRQYSTFSNYIHFVAFVINLSARVCSFVLTLHEECVQLRKVKAFFKRKLTVLLSMVPPHMTTKLYLLYLMIYQYGYIHT